MSDEEIQAAIEDALSQMTWHAEEKGTPVRHLRSPTC